MSPKEIFIVFPFKRSAVLTQITQPSATLGCVMHCGAHDYSLKRHPLCGTALNTLVNLSNSPFRIAGVAQ